MKYFYTTTRISENMHETPEGFLVCVGVPIARTGEMIYGEGETPLETDDDGTVVVTRDEKDVFNPKTMASFEGKPVTIMHPSEFVTPENWARLAKGVVQNVRRGVGDSKNDLIADLLVTDSVAINLIKSGLREVSCGYEASYSQDEDGEGKQTRIIGNHLALVDQGRAGSSYAINDHKGRGIKTMKFREKIKSIFATAQDEAMKMAEDEMGEKKEEKKEESKDSPSYDELVQICKDMLAKMDKLSASHDEAKEEKKDDSKDDAPEEKKDEEEAKDDDQVEASIEDRLKALEASVSKLLEGMASEESMEEKEESEDDDLPESTMAGDSASRIEILAPGMKAEGKDAKALALRSAYATKEGKAVIDSLTNGKPTFDSKEKVDVLFIAASEVLKASRTAEMSKTKKGCSSTEDSASKNEPMTAEKMNELNSNFYKRS